MESVKKSDSLANLAIALAKFQATAPTVAKTKANPFFKSKYAGLDDIIHAIQKPLSAQGLSYVQLPGDATLTTILMHGESGEFIESTMHVGPKKSNDPQALGSAITYARRYALASILGLAIGDEDDDGNGANKPQPKQQGKKRTLTDSQLKEAIGLITTGDFTTEKLETAYQLTEAQNEVLAAFKKSSDVVTA